MALRGSRNSDDELASGWMDQNPTAGEKQMMWPYEIPGFGCTFVL
jgi:hypothetical protein